MEFINDLTYICLDCDMVFKAYIDNDCVTGFCPNCKSTLIDEFEENY